MIGGPRALAAGRGLTQSGFQAKGFGSRALSILTATASCDILSIVASLTYRCPGEVLLLASPPKGGVGR